jgi:vacuolar protein sorting-associated protein 45
MIHELLTIKNNRVIVPGVKIEEPEVVVSQHDDDFFDKIMFRNFGEVADEIQKHVQGFLEKKKSTAQFRQFRTCKS